MVASFTYQLPITNYQLPITKMTVEEIIQQLKRLPDDAEVRVKLDSDSASKSIDEILYIDHETIFIII
ncbi:hypothetical protein H6G54_12120 [Anabaena cylindrica FACHB-243]|uniref:Uncharacterized protein n=1 Tax=Anabaena cylindrica (strain ATCC 27899 / PCC 7122) TaxID=272123 RepID=K9ZCF4_ANACC|nr:MULTISPECIES: hypothetical protein [Anabaena]AFZ56903.1 hypothetical protein Anacy_1392 [Anabaena cylindrica PCC 7122]MBD2418429.1 hypothetical protein [Anabaena cylindrica FACHB-243]MBY5284890.1 hypothetical protein [Anabaena sp. CCAP 1446/1C]MBY5307652.1 hypothetical protein [Anabaena sp. CCAP 1446/1C]MCM2409387.1 hypothetical protein [Anabaena sp. CCAP 1446/1C]